LLLADVVEADRDQFRRALQRLFPKLLAAWSNTHHGAEWEKSWQRKRLICSPEHFSTYFRFKPQEEVLPAREINEVIQRAGDRAFIQSSLRSALKERLRSGSTRASIFLNELIIRAEDIARGDIESLLGSLFEIAEELDVIEDERRGFGSIGDNMLRLHWLMNNLVRERVPQPERTSLIVKALQNAPLYWYCALASRCYREHHPTPDTTVPPEGERFVDADTADRLSAGALKRIRAAAKNGTIASQRRLVPLLYQWIKLSPRNTKEVRPAAAKLLKSDEFVINMAVSATGRVWSRTAGGLGDLVSRGSVQIDRRSIEGLVDAKKFLRRVDILTKSPQTERAVAGFLAAVVQMWNRGEGSE
jgi:hypothetical protein